MYIFFFLANEKRENSSENRDLNKKKTEKRTYRHFFLILKQANTLLKLTYREREKERKTNAATKTRWNNTIMII